MIKGCNLLRLHKIVLAGMPHYADLGSPVPARCTTCWCPGDMLGLPHVLVFDLLRSDAKSVEQVKVRVSIAKFSLFICGLHAQRDEIQATATLCEASTMRCFQCSTFRKLQNFLSNIFGFLLRIKLSVEVSLSVCRHSRVYNVVNKTRAHVATRTKLSHNVNVFSSFPLVPY